VAQGAFDDDDADAIKIVTLSWVERNGEKKNIYFSLTMQIQLENEKRIFVILFYMFIFWVEYHSSFEKKNTSS